MSKPSLARFRWQLHFLALAVVLLLPAARALCQEEEDDELELERGRPGLVATWTDPHRSLARIEGRLAFRLSERQTPHPQLSPDDFSGRWRGRLFVLRPGTYRFSAEVAGKFELRIEGRTVLRAQSGAGDITDSVVGETVELSYGLASLEATYAKQAGADAVLRLHWQREDEHREPVPGRVLRHVPADKTEQLARWQPIEAGRDLVARHQCLHCHTASPAEARLVATTTVEAPVLDAIGNRAYRTWIYHWLKQPHAFRPTTTMPSLFGDSPEEQADLYAATEFLAAEGGRLAPRDESPDLQRAQRGAQTFASVGCIACHRALDEADDAFTNVRRLDGLGSKTDPAGIRKAIAEPWAFHPTSRMPDFELTERQPEVLEDLVHYLAGDRAEAFQQEPALPSPKVLIARFRQLVADPQAAETFEQAGPSRRWRLLGQEVVSRRGCLACHRLGELRDRSVQTAGFTALVTTVKQHGASTGCLAANPVAPAPDFRLDEYEREAIRQFFIGGIAGQGSEAPIYETERRLDRHGCTACHQRAGRGGVFAERITRFVDLGSDVTVRDVAPPDLSGVGEKLTPAWLRDVIESGARSRPWMSLRMPTMQNEVVVGLAEGLMRADAAGPSSTQSPSQNAVAEQKETGRLLVGSTGFNCVSCHDIAGVQSTGVRGPDLAGVYDRVRHDWFTRWMLNPQTISPGTRMPSVFFAGSSAAPQYLGGDPAAQIAALWAYFSDGRRMRLPELGPSTEALVEGGETPRVVPKQSPVLVRGYLGEHAGVRGIALGLPEGTHFGFDSQRCRLVSVWQGAFLERQGWFDAGRGGAEKDGDRVLGTVIWREPEGWNWAIEDASDFPSPAPVRRFDRVGYDACWASTSDAGFAYHLEVDGTTLSVEERPAALPGADFPAFRRHLKVTAVPANRALRIRVAQRALPRGSSVFFDPSGTPKESQSPNDAVLSHPASAAVWVSAKIGKEAWLLTARGIPKGTQWRVFDGTDVVSDQQPPSAAGEIWLRFPPGAPGDSITCELIYLRPNEDRPVDFKALGALLDRRRPVVNNP